MKQKTKLRHRATGIEIEGWRRGKKFYSPAMREISIAEYDVLFYWPFIFSWRF